MPDSPWEALVAAHRRAKPALAAQREAPQQPLRHEPTAAILACSDARVPPSVLFDQPAGNLFVVRIAGNTAVPSAVASLDYAVAELGVGLIVVLGHTMCGAVAAATSGTCGGHLEPIVAPICAIAQSHPDADADEISVRNVKNTLKVLADHDGPVGHASATGQVDLRGAMYDLTTGRLTSVLNQTKSPVEAS